MTDARDAALAEIIPLYRLSLQAERLSRNTVRVYLEAVTHFIQHCPLPAGQIKREHIEGFLASLHERNTSATVHNRYRALRRFFNFVVEECGLAAGPMDRMKPPRLEEKVVRPYTAEQVQAMLSACGTNWQGLRDRALILVLYDTGLRREECLALTVADIHNERIIVHGKGSKERVVRIGHQAQMALERYRLRCPRVPYLWVGYGGKLGESGLYQVIRRIGAKAGIPDATVHRFRHSYATSYLMAGGDRYDLQQSLGHSSDLVTKRYISFVSQEHALREHERFSPGDQLFPGRLRVK